MAGSSSGEVSRHAAQVLFMVDVAILVWSADVKLSSDMSVQSVI